MATSASKLPDETGKGCPPQSLLLSSTKKRKHAETGDGSPQSQPPPSTEKRNRVENVEQAPQSLPPTEEKEHRNVIGKKEWKIIDKSPEDAQARYLKIKESYGALWDLFDMGNHRGSDELIGNTGDLLPDPYPDPKQNSLGHGADGG